MNVTICIITFRRKDGLSRLLDGLNCLRFYKCEPPTLNVIVVENERGGPAQVVCAEKRENFRWGLTYEVEERRGISYARNKALSCAEETDFIAFIDDDEIPEPDWLDEMLWVQQEYGADVVAGPVLPYFQDEAPKWIDRGKFFERPRYRTGHLLRFASTNNTIVRAEILKKMDVVFDEQYAITGGSDTHLFMRIHRAGYKMIWADQAVVSEWVPGSRLRTKWILQRAYRIGNTMSRVEADIKPSLKIRLIRFGKGCVRILAALVFIPCSLLLGRHRVVQALSSFYRGAGMLAGMMGARYEEYRTTHSV